MNNVQRKQIKEAVKYLQEIHDNIDFGFNDNIFLQDIADEEQEKLDNLPENFQSSEKATNFQLDIEKIETAIGEVEESAEYLIQAMDAIENAINALNEI
jgi:hypothetical protein